MLICLLLEVSKLRGGSNCRPDTWIVASRVRAILRPLEMARQSGDLQQEQSVRPCLSSSELRASVQRLSSMSAPHAMLPHSHQTQL